MTLEDMNSLSLGRFSLGVGDRFGRQAGAQLQACLAAARLGVTVIPVWNKSNREHSVIGSEPSSVRAAADKAVGELGWRHPYFVDADHVNLATVDRFVESSDFFTLDVAIAIGSRSDSVDAFLARHPELVGKLHIAGVAEPLSTTPDRWRGSGRSFSLPLGRPGASVAASRESRQGAPS